MLLSDFISIKTNNAKKEYSINSGYNFLFIIDKNYSELEKIIKLNDALI